MNIYNVLWENVEALAIKRFGAYTRNKLVKDSLANHHPISTGTLQRIESKQTSIGLDVLHEIARYFKVNVNLLLVPNAFNGVEINKIEERRESIEVGGIEIQSDTRYLINEFNKLSHDNQHFIKIAINHLYNMQGHSEKKANPYQNKPKKVKSND